MNDILAPVSAGELLDKLSILEIKSTRILDPAKKANVDHELSKLRKVAIEAGLATATYDPLMNQLRSVNQALWDIEDHIRECEHSADFGAQFVELARSVYKTNDRRAAIKFQINTLSGSDIVEEKSYQPY